MKGDQSNQPIGNPEVNPPINQAPQPVINQPQMQPGLSSANSLNQPTIASQPSAILAIISLVLAGVSLIPFLGILSLFSIVLAIGSFIRKERKLMSFLAIISLATIIEKHKKAYYLALEEANQTNEITNWIKYFVSTIMEAQSFTQSKVEFLIQKTKFYEKYSALFNERQSKVIERIFKESLDGFKGGLSAENYSKLT